MGDQFRFDGEGYSREPITGEEAARHRHMFREISRDWLPLANAAMVANAIRIIFNIIKIGGPVALMALAAGAWARSQGLV